MNALQQPERVCWACASFTQALIDGREEVACIHQPDGAPAPLHPHAQRSRQAGEAENVCGSQGIVWKARQ